MQLDAESYEGDTPLSIAYGKGHTDVVRSLIETGRFNLQAKALLLAAQAGDQATVDVLLAEGMQPDAGGYQGDSPLSVACGRGHIGMVRSLIETGYTDLQREEGVGESTPLMAALKAGHQEIVYVLLATGTKLDAMRYKGDTPLSIACENGYIGIVRSLIEVGCVDMRTEEVKDQKTPLLSAIRGGRLDIVELLLAAGNCNVNACEKLARKAPNPPVKGMTVLHMVALRQGWEHVAELMLADPNITPNKTARRWEETPLITAAWAGNEAMTRVFLDSPKVDFKAADKQGQNALIHAVQRGHNNIVATIIESKRVDLHARDNRGFSAFHLAAGKGHYGIVKQLLDTGEVDPNQRAKCGKTALHLACTDSKFQAVVRLLLAQPNINPNALDKHDSTPLHQARVNKARMAEGLLLKFRDKADATRIHTGSGRSMIGVWPRLATSEIGLDLTNDKENTPADYAAETHHDAMLNESACHTRKRKLHDIESENVESVVSSKQRLDVIHSEDDVVSVSSSDTDSEDAALFSSNVADSEDVASVSSKDELDDIDSDDDVIVVAMKRKLDDDEIVVAPQRRGN
jgi:ankyrin repeat protein